MHAAVVSMQQEWLAAEESVGIQTGLQVVVSTERNTCRRGLELLNPFSLFDPAKLQNDSIFKELEVLTMPIVKILALCLVKMLPKNRMGSAQGFVEANLPQSQFAPDAAASCLEQYSKGTLPQS